MRLGNCETDKENGRKTHLRRFGRFPLLQIRQNFYFAELFVDFVNRHCPVLLVCSYQK